MSDSSEMDVTPGNVDPPDLPPYVPARDDSSEFSFQPVPSSGPHTSDVPDNFADLSAVQKRDIVSDSCRLSVDYAKSVLDRLPATTSGWCELVSLAPTKQDGYIQVSFGGANKFAMLQMVVLWAAGRDLYELEVPYDEQASHRCHQPRCKTVGHVCPESVFDNNLRKGCLVWIDCHHCGKKILICRHDPVCIKFVEGYSSMEDFIQNGGICRDLRDEV